MTLVSDCFQFAYCLSPSQCHLCGRTSWLLVPNDILFNKYHIKFLHSSVGGHYCSFIFGDYI